MREFLTSAKGIVALVFTILGVVFSAVGLVIVVVALVTQAAGAPGEVGIGVGAGGAIFLGIGFVFGGIGLWLGMLRKAELRQRARLRDSGVSCDAMVVEVKQDFRVRVNRQYPWLVTYRYRVGAEEHEGSERIMDLPPTIKQGETVAVVYDPADPRQSAIK